MTWWTRWKDKYGEVVEEYGTAAIVTYIALRLSAMLGFWIAISYGFEVGTATGNAGTFWAAWAGSKVTQPLWMALTVVLTPIAVRIWRRFRPLPPPPASPAP